jgi:hypothetical protein
MACVVFLVMSLDASTARASQGEVATWLDVSLATAHDVTDAGPQLGIGTQLGALIGLSDFWGVTAGVDGAYHFPVEYDEASLRAISVQSLFAGFRYNLDIFAYVPYLGIAIGEYIQAPPIEPGAPQRPAVGPRLTLGIDWRFDRHWSVGLKADLHALSFDIASFPSYSTIGIAVGYHFRL